MMMLINCLRLKQNPSTQKMVPKLSHTSLAATISKANTELEVHKFINKAPPREREREREAKKDCSNFKERAEKKSMEAVNYANNIDFSIINNIHYPSNWGLPHQLSAPQKLKFVKNKK